MKSAMTRKHTTIAAVALLGLAASACEIETGATELDVVVAQEDGFFSDGDEPYVAIIQWRVTPGELGSTEVALLSGVNTLSDGAFEGTTLPIPAAEGVVTFDNVVPVANQQLATGSLPEILGTVVVAMESDQAPLALADNVFLDVADDVEDALVAEIESLTFTDLTDGFAVSFEMLNPLNNVFDGTADAVDTAMDVWFSGLGDPDDLVGVSYTVYPASAGPLSTVMNFVFDGTIGARAVGGAWTTNLDPKFDTLDFTNGESTYRVDIVATSTP